MLANVRFLAGFRRDIGIDPALKALLYEILNEPATIGDVERRASHAHPELVVRAHILHMLWTGALSTDMSTPLSGSSTVERVA